MKKPAAGALKRVLEKSKADLFKKAHVVGVGIGEKITGGMPTGRICLKVYVEKKLQKNKLSKGNLVPQTLSQIETDVEEVGKIKALANTQRQRPAPGGASIGHFKITAGTLGCLVKDKKTGRMLILSNNHVLANSNKAKKGDFILQPGAYDGGRVGPDTIARLHRFVEIKFKDAANFIDSALAEPLNAKDVSPEISLIGVPKGVTQPMIGMSIQKSGRTTELTTGKIKDVNAAVKVNYDNQTAIFHDQILTTAMSQGGDSGSLVLDEKKQALGLLFAGSETVTLCNPIQEVLKQLNVEIAT